MDRADEVIISDYSKNDWRNGKQSLDEKIKQLENDIFKVAQELIE